MRRIFIVLTLILGMSYGQAAASEDVFKLGISLPLSGELASYGDDIKAGVQLAVDDINSRGGVLGKNLLPLFEDDGNDPKIGVTVANHFLSENVVMAAAFTSKVCMSAAPVYAEENIPFINQCNTDAITQQGWPNVIRAYLKNSQEAPRLAQLIAKKASNHKLAILYFNEEYNMGLATKTLKLLSSSYHITPEAVYKMFEKNEDFSSLITKLKDQKIEVVYIGFWPKAVGLFLRQAAAVDYHPQFIGNLASSLEDVVKIAGPTSDELSFTASPDPQYIASASSVVKALATRNIVHRPLAIYAYFLVQIYAGAVQKAGATESEKVLQALKSNKFSTILGPVTFTDSGDMSGIDFDYYQWHKGEMVPLKN